MPRESTRRCKRCQRKRPLRFYATPRGRICKDCQKAGRRSYSKDVRLSETYGITLEEYQRDIVDAQGGVCAICGRKPRYPLNVDHDHALERAGVVGRANVRGGLCRLCNGRLLPAARDDVEVLKAAIRYLEAPPFVGYDPTMPYEPEESPDA